MFLLEQKRGYNAHKSYFFLYTHFYGETGQFYKGDLIKSPFYLLSCTLV